MPETDNAWSPWEHHPSLTAERLSIVATALRDCRDDALDSYEPLKGETGWSLGCCQYDRSKFCIRELSRVHSSWLSTVNETSALRCTFAIEGIPVRFFHQTTEDPPMKYTERTDGEYRMQMLLAVDGIPFRETLFRLAIKDYSNGKVESVTLVEFDDTGACINEYTIPFGLASSNVTTIQAKPVILEPIKLEPIESEANDEKMGNDKDDSNTGTK